jgi:hypothetical protein
MNWSIHHIFYSNCRLLLFGLNIFIFHKVLVGRPQAWKYSMMEKSRQREIEKREKKDALAPFSPLSAAL